MAQRCSCKKEIKKKIENTREMCYNHTIQKGLFLHLTQVKQEQRH